MKAQKVFALLIVLALAAGCTAGLPNTNTTANTNSNANPNSNEAMIDNPGFRYISPEGWTKLPGGEGLCEPGDECLVSKEGGTLATSMTALDAGCPGANSLVECLDQIEKGYKETKPGFKLSSREDFTTSFGLTGQILEYTTGNGATQVEELWTHNGGLKIRVRYAAPPAVFQTLRDEIFVTFLSVRPNEPGLEKTKAAAETPAVTASPSP